MEDAFIEKLENDFYNDRHELSIKDMEYVKKIYLETRGC